MPGYFYHLACANIVRNSGYLEGLDSASFFLGNFIPDLAIDKRISHYQHLTNTGWLAPNIYEAKEDITTRAKSLEDPNQSLLLGVYCHLFLDHFFIRRYLSKKYYLEKGHVFQTHGLSFWDPDYFLSPSGLYGDYSSCNLFLIRDGYIPVFEIFTLPENPPLTGIYSQDNRGPENWKSTLESYLANPAEYTGKFFTYEELKEMVESGAEAFLKDICTY